MAVTGTFSILEPDAFMAERISVLLIEDDINDAEQVKRAFVTFSPAIFDVHHVSKFRDGVAQIKQRPFHVVILDLGLPDSVGLNGVERLMSMIPKVPVIVLTGMDDDEAALAGIAMGAQEVLDKNEVSSKRLIRTIKHAIKRKQYSLEQSGSKANSSDHKRLEKLAEIMRDTTAVVTARTGSLMKTTLTSEQRAMVDDINSKSLESAEALDRLAPETVVFFEQIPDDD